MKKSTIINNGLEQGVNISSINSNGISVTHIKSRRKRLLKYAGFNALELMLVLAVIAVGIGVAIRTMTGNSNSQNTNQMVSDITALVGNIKSSYTSSTAGYTTLTTDTAIQGTLIPTDLKTNGTTVQNQFQSGTVALASENNGEAFSITYTAVPSAICNKAIVSLASSSFVTISVGGTAVYDAINAPTIDAATVAGACNNATNTIAFVAS